MAAAIMTHHSDSFAAVRLQSCAEPQRRASCVNQKG